MWEIYAHTNRNGLTNCCNVNELGRQFHGVHTALIILVKHLRAVMRFLRRLCSVDSFQWRIHVHLMAKAQGLRRRRGEVCGQRVGGDTPFLLAVGPPERAVPTPEVFCKLHAEKVKFGA